MSAAPLLSPEEVAQRCGLSRRAVYRAIERGELRASRLCSRLRIHPDDLEAWRRTNYVETSQPPMTAPPAPLPPRNGFRSLLAASNEEVAK